MRPLIDRLEESGTVNEPRITISLTPDEALVLSDWLERLQISELGDAVDDPAVWAPLHRVAGTLDKALPALLARSPGSEAEHLAAAQARLRGEDPV
ncbi:hypothetical protein [Streptomyces iconiensis]|uniref:Uncharacterized protein n=1 Tax=Streptomyces iconiensis TaxID=1384038 RepID=A0ABT7A9S9_9ACTN|nr:hypothetical protein [Streptomyces iconiensis]MDJ1137353.1 hypothetical protein [Streptomyces iconiensis]